MTQAELVSIERLTDTGNKPPVIPLRPVTSEGSTTYTSPKGVTFDPFKHEISKQTGLPAIRSDGEFKKLRGWQGHRKATQANKAQAPAEESAQAPAEESAQAPAEESAQAPEPEGLPESEFDLPPEGETFTSPEETAETERMHQHELDLYIEQQARNWMQASEGILIMAIGDEWIFTEDEHRVLARPAARCMKKYGIYELAPELDLLIAAIMITKARLTPKHPTTTTLWSKTKSYFKEKTIDVWYWMRRKKRSKTVDVDAEVMSDNETEKAEKESILGSKL